jgi:DNA-binding protein HU-beta
MKGETKMNKADLISEVAKIVRTKKNAQAAVDCVFASITKALKKADAVTLVGFGTFKVVNRKARAGRNPSTGEALHIKASKAAKFVPGKALKDALR